MNEAERKAYDNNPNIILKIKGKRFFCSCGGNVFQNINYNKDKYRCNSCASTFTTT